MTRRSSLPLRWDAAARPRGLPVAIPPARMTLLRGGRPLKRWRYVAVFCDELMLCAAVATVGPARSSWWAVRDRHAATLHERTRRAPGPALATGCCSSRRSTASRSAASRARCRARASCGAASA
jgi:hypothetical protein